MYRRIFRHLLFWIIVALLYATVKLSFPAPSDLVYPLHIRLARGLFTELAFLPWKAIPFYVLFYWLLPRYLPREAYTKIVIGSLVVLFACSLGYRSMIQPVSVLLYGDAPDFYVFSLPRIFFSLTEIIPVAGLAAAVKLLGDRRQEQQKIRTLQAEKRKAELHFLRAQTNPHFLFNTLNNLYGIARKEAGNTAPYLLKLSRIMRYILKECNSPTIPLSIEFRVIEDYISLEQLRFDDSLRVSIQTEVDQWESPIAPLILLPFVENAFKHGAGESRNAPEVLVHLQLVAGKLVFIVENTTEVSGSDYVPGTGLSNVNRQLDLIYGDRYQLDVSAQPEKFTVQLTIQLPHG